MISPTGILRIGDQNMTMLATPTIQDWYGVSMEKVQWVKSLVSICFAAMGVLGSKLGDRFGNGIVIRYAINITAIGCLGEFFTGLYAPQTELGFLVFLFFRAIVAVGQGLCRPQTNPTYAKLGSDLPKTIARNTLAITSANVFAPLLGGVFCDSIGWQYIYLFLFGVCCWWQWQLRRLPPIPPVDAEGHFDYGGASLFTSIALLMVFGVSELANDAVPRWLVYLSLLSATALIPLLIRTERKCPFPIMPVWLVTHKRIASCVSTSFLNGMCMQWASFYITYVYQLVFGMSEKATGVLMMINPVGMALCTTFLGVWLYRNVSARNVMMVGPSMAGLATIVSGIGAVTSPWIVCIGVVIKSCAMGSYLVTMNSYLLQSTPKRYAGVTSGLNGTLFQIGCALGVACSVFLNTLFLNFFWPYDVPAPDTPDYNDYLSAYGRACCCMMILAAVPGFLTSLTSRALGYCRLDEGKKFYNPAKAFETDIAPEEDKLIRHQVRQEV
ncbi:major facilitator superfamily protein [Kipferlia bialata]|uniref:Major facilitator superfamily protein n=1 Tax=Kipferlia bialata TaxID=797122 RepID=A0A9K3CTV3_9EUKA|nr:major facilitator superfamily protein [Kipferlia bialata]|eukprot:g3061.t1